MTQPNHLSMSGEEEIDKILAVFAHYEDAFQPGYEDTVIKIIEDAKGKLKYLLQKKYQEGELNGRRIQSEAILSKWEDFPDDGDFTMFLHGQVDAWKYEQSQHTKEETA